MSSVIDKASVLLVDDHPLLRQTIAIIVSAQPDFTICGEASDLPTALQIAEQAKPDIAVLDLDLKSGDRMEAVKTFKQRFPQVKVLVFSGLSKRDYAARVIRGGAMGFVGKDEPVETLLTALRKVTCGRQHLSAEIEGELLHSLKQGEPSLKSPEEVLSNRELEVLTLIGEGHGSRAIAKLLKVSPKTIHSHKAHIKQRLNLKTAMELARHAIRWAQKQNI